MLRIALSDDHQLFRKSLVLLVNSFEGMQVVLEAADGKELLEKLKTTRVDILLLDLQMSGMDGFETALEISKHYPEIKILVLTLLNEKDTIKKVMKLGVQGYFTKNTNPNELKNAILKLNDQGFYFEENLTSIVQDIIDSSAAVKRSQPVTFTEREMQIVHLILKEYNGNEIGKRLNISPRTVEKHKRNLMDKTGSKNFIGVITYALLHDFLSI
ncbi:response regulator [Mesonia ostreae]|uniref:Response regulator transcription factor n=1 Tax=Mesonia ostreae TaxID=861110 RepID=A0ABU2KJF0_9FLAO|nr:response regulator transcription factor [Mesonia ostreae]MDT0294846.1 response regulator transcription factor [Mesonia ostreae]